MKFTKEEIVKLLENSECVVTFTKVDGEIREMPCTLKPALLPAVVVVEGTEKKERKENHNVVSVFCTDKQAWRSFRLENIISITN